MITAIVFVKADVARIPQVAEAIAAVDGVIVENLCNLEGLGAGPYTLSVLPLRLTGADGGPCRAVAIPRSPAS